MMSRTLFVLMALALSMPALAQTPVVTLKAADEVVAAIFSPRGDRIAAAVGKDRIAVWSLPDGKLLQELKFPARTSRVVFAPSDQIIVALADGAIEVRAIATGAGVRRIKADGRQSVLAVSADGRLLATSRTEQIHLWDSSGKLLRTFGHEFGSMCESGVFAGRDAAGKRRARRERAFLGRVDRSAEGLGARPAAVDLRHRVHRRRQAARDRRCERRDRNHRRANGVGRPPFARRKVRGEHAQPVPDGRSIGAAYFDVDGMARPAPLAVWDLASGRVVRRATPDGAPAEAAGFTTDGRLLYVTRKGQELNVWALPGSGASSAGSRSSPGSAVDR